jgi:hypothetical protein
MTYIYIYHTKNQTNTFQFKDQYLETETGINCTMYESEIKLVEDQESVLLYVIII